MSIPPVIIIAEPDPIFGTMLRVEFSRAGFAVLMATSGPEAEEFAARADAQLILLDAALPGVSSFDACVRIRHLPYYRATPIVLTVRTLETRIEDAAVVAGATILLAKPYAFGDLLDALETHLAGDDPLLNGRTVRPGVAEPAGMRWGPLPPLTWRSNPNSGLSQNARMLPIVRGAGVRIPLRKKP